MNTDTLTRFLASEYADTQAERDALCYILENGLDEVRDLLTAADFTDARNKAVFRAMEELCNAGRGIDLASVVEATEGKLEGDTSTRIRYIASLVDGTAIASNGRAAVGYLRELSFKREVRDAMATAAASLETSGTDADKVLTDLTERMHAILNTSLSVDEMPGQLDLSKPIAEPVALVSRGDDEVIHMGDVQMIDGLSKSGKSTVCTAIAAAVLGGRPSDCLGFAGTMEGSRVLWIDTEQHQRNTAKMARRVLRMAGLATNANCPRFAVLSWRGKTPNEQARLLFRTARRYRPQLVVLDGIADIIGDFNDIEQSTEIVTRLMGLAAELDCSILSVLHTNPGGKRTEQKATGTLGSVLYKKCSMEIQVTATEDGKDARREVRFLKCRNGNPEKFWFSIDENGPHLCTPIPAATKQREKLEAHFAQVLVPGEIVAYGKLVQRIIQSGIAERTAKSRIKAARDLGIIDDYGGGLRLHEHEHSQDHDDDLPL